MTEHLFVDTSAWFAYVNKSDRDHEKVRQVLRAFKGRLVTSNFVFDETVTLCLYRLGHQIVVKVGETLLNTAEIDLVHLGPDDERLAWKLVTTQIPLTGCQNSALSLSLTA